MAAEQRAWRGKRSATELLTELRSETCTLLQESMPASGSGDSGTRQGFFDILDQTSLHKISTFALYYLEQIKPHRIKAMMDAVKRNIDSETNYDKIKSTLELVEESCRAVASDLLREGKSEWITVLRNGLTKVQGLVTAELEKEEEQRPGSGTTLDDTGEILGGTLEVDPSFCQPLAQSQQQNSDARFVGRGEHTSAERHRPTTPQNQKRHRALLSPGLDSRIFKRQSCEDLSMAADDTRQRFQGEGVQREEKSDGEEAGKPDPEGRARSFGALKSELLAGRRTILLPSWVAQVGTSPREATENQELTLGQGQLDVLEGLKALALGEKEWHCCWVSKEEIESASSDWSRLKQLPGVHVVRNLRADIGPHISGERTYYEVAVCDSYQRQLLSNGFQLQAVSIEPVDWTVPSNEEIRVHGMGHAEETVAGRAEDYIECASKALESGLGPGLDGFYRRFAPSGLRVTMEWIILMRRLLTADDKLFRHFAQSCVALCLSLLQDMEGLAAEELRLRDLTSWREFFRLIRGDRLKWPPGDRTAEPHDIAVLRYIMDHSGFERDTEPLQHCFDDACSNEEKLDRLGSLFDLGMGPHTGSNEDIVSEAFSRAQVWGEGTWEAARALVLMFAPGYSQGR